MHPWDNLEQELLNYSGTVAGLAQAITKAAEQIEDSGVADTIMNLGIGLEVYAKTAIDSIADKMEEKISFDYSRLSWDLEVSPDNSLVVPPYITESLQWTPGQILAAQSGLGQDGFSISISPKQG